MATTATKQSPTSTVVVPSALSSHPNTHSPSPSSPSSASHSSASSATSVGPLSASKSPGSLLASPQRSSAAGVGSPFGDSADDIESIAKQISDHAEAIYQTWKARGLAPTEILNCHTVGGGETFGKALTPAPNPYPSRRSIGVTSPTPSAASLLLSSSHDPLPAGQPAAAAAPDMSNNNNLEKLVSSFVSEDKARQQQQQATSGRIVGKSSTSSILTSGTIRDALRKFESAERLSPNGTASGAAAGSAAPKRIRSSFVLRNGSNGAALGAQRMPSSPSIGAQSPPSPAASSPASVSHLAAGGASNSAAVTSTSAGAPSSSSATSANHVSSTLSDTSATAATSAALPNATAGPSTLNKHVPDVLMNTIERTAALVTSPSSLPASKESSPPPAQKPQTPAKPASLINRPQPAWPLKGRASIHASTPVVAPSASDSNGARPSAERPSALNGAASAEPAQQKASAKAAASTSRRAAADLLDEVLQEEERLINALKTGTVLSCAGNSASNHTLPEVIQSTMQPDCGERVWPPQEPSVLGSASGAPANGTSSAHQNGKTAGRATGRDEADNAATAIVTNGVGKTKAAVSDMPASALAAMKISKSARPRNDAAVPHPEISVNTAKLISTLNSSSSKSGVSMSTVRPFLARGSVAERVLMFEKCPDHQPLRREPSKLAAKPIHPTPEHHTTLQRRIRSSKNVYIPKFYYPHGKPTLTVINDNTVQRIQSAFDALPNRLATRDNFDPIVEACGYPRYWRMPLFGCAQATPGGPADCKRFIEFWKEMNVHCHDDTSRFIYIMARGDRTRPYIKSDDLTTLVQDVVDTHPGLAFLKEASEFHSRYVHTVIARIFYAVNRSWSGRITIPELRRSNLLQVLKLLEDEEDINQIMAYFSYEHFYVIYCKFWELDRDHDLFIDQNDLARHNEHALSSRIIERIFSGCVTKAEQSRSAGTTGGRMSYTEFVWFLLSEEDKTHPTAVEYWFRCMDLDGDGVLSMYELEYFYEEQQHRMESIGIETLPFEDCLCQMLDMVKPKRTGFVTLGDLKRCKTTPIFFDTFFNLEKYMEHEQRDPFATQRDQDEMTDWDRFAAQEYELLVAEEGGDTQGSSESLENYKKFLR